MGAWGGGVTHIGISNGKGVKILKPSVIVYGYFLELDIFWKHPIVILT